MDHRAEIDRRMPRLIAAARAASRRNKSYRDFQVGCAVLARNGKHYRIFVGTNAKPIEGGPKICAEQAAVMSAIGSGYRHIVAMVVAGTPQADDVSGVQTDTLQPCFNCRTIFGAILQAELPVFTVHNHAGPTHEHTLGAIIALHSHT